MDRLRKILPVLAAFLAAFAPGMGRASAAVTYTLVTEPNQGLTAFYNLVSSAQHTIDMTMYELNDTTFEQLLATAVQNGVTVRVILDQNLEKANNQAAYTYLSNNGVSVHWANPTYAATHQKTITIDSATSAIMTLNLTSQYYSTSRDFAVIENDPTDVAAIETTFNADFKNATVTPPDGDDLVWSPTNSQTSMVNLINAAQHTLQVENEEMSDTAIVNALSSAAQRGVNLQIIMTNISSYTSELNQIVAAGGQVSTYAQNAPLYIHAKVILADYGFPTASVFVGSENFSSASLTENRELGLIFNNGPILSSLNQTLSEDFVGGTAYTGSKFSDFTISSNTAALSVSAGSSATATVTGTPTSGFTSTVTLSASGLPSGVTASFSPATLTGGKGTSTVKFTASASAASGAFAITLLGTGGGLIENTVLTLTVTGSAPAFSLTASPASLTVTQGSTGTSTISSSVSGGFNAAIALSASGLPSGVTASFNPATIAAPGSGSSTLTLTASASAAPGTYPVTITGTGGGLSNTTSVSLTVASSATPSFTLTANPTAVSIAAGGSGSSSLTTAIAGGFNAAISFSATGVPSGVTASFNPASIAAPGAGTSTLTFSSTAAVAAGTYPISVTGTGGGLTHTVTVTLTVTAGTSGFTLSVSPSSLTVAAGAAGTVTVTSKITGSFNAAISLSASGLPTGVTAAFNPTSIAAPGSGSSSLTLTASGSAASGTFPITISGTGGGQTATTGVSLTVSGAAGGQLIVDGGFESATKSGDSAPGWTATTNNNSHNVIVVSGTYPHGGKNYARLGAYNNETDTLTQTITVPAGATSAPLTFWVNITTQETGTSKYDFLYVEIHNSGGTLLATPLTLSNTDSKSDNNTSGQYFQPPTIDLSSYAGQTIEIVFRGTTDYEKTTTFLIDDVSASAN